jgi:hypothetical protein
MVEKEWFAVSFLSHESSITTTPKHQINVSLRGGTTKQSVSFAGFSTLNLQK